METNLDDIRTGKRPFRLPSEYMLIERQCDKKSFRFRPRPGMDVPEGYVHLENSYDEEGRLFPQFWALLRWTPEIDKPKEVPSGNEA